MTQNYAETLRIDKGPRCAKHRRELRELFLKQQRADGDEGKVEALMHSYRERAINSGQRAREEGSRECADRFLADAMALFLLASEPRVRASRLAEELHSRYSVSRHKETTLLTLILKALGPYPRGSRRIVHRDGVVLEFLICKGYLPDAARKYLGTPGQGIDQTYRRAQDFFQRGNSKRPRRRQLLIEPKLDAKITNRRSHSAVFGLLIPDKRGFVMNHCLIDPTQVKATIEFVRALRSEKVPKTVPPIEARGRDLKQSVR
jgi:hypothetical protein